jgi:N-acetylglucosaminyl-diphospho-decaprenol L-rhamnosyltransferase
MDPTDQNAPLITVVVVNFNGGEHVRRCVASLVAQTFRNFETIIVDNASSDGSIDLIGELPPQTLILHERINHGFAGGNNLAALKGRGRWLALLNPDAEAAPDWLESMMRAVTERPTHRIVASLQIAKHDAAVLDGAGDCYLAYGYAWRGGYGRSVSETPGAGECFAPCGAAALYPRDLVLDIGGFDERYFCYHEDVDLGFRMRLLGERCQFDPRCQVKHMGSGITGKASDFSVFHGARNGFWTYIKNMPGPLLVLTLPVWTVATLAILVRGMATGRLGATARGLGAALYGLAPALRARRAMHTRRRAGLRAIAGALEWNPLVFLARKARVRPFADPDVTGRKQQPALYRT